MSKFFGAGSSSDSSSESSDSETEQQNIKRPAGGAAAANRAFIFSDDEDDTRRVVKSAKEKSHEQINAIMKTIRNSRKIKDFNKMESSFLELVRSYDKAKPVLMKDAEGGQAPRFYVRILVEMEDLINETWEDRDYRKTMSKINAKSLGALRQKLRKYIRENLEDDVAKFRENPDAEDEPEDQDEAGDAEESDSESDSDDEEGGKRRKSGSKSRESSAPLDKAKFKKGAADDDDSDDSYWDSDSDESDSSSSDDEPGMSLREKFLKKSTTDLKKKEKKPKAEKERKKKRLRDVEEEDEDDDDDDGKGKDKWQTVDRGGLEKPKMFEKDAEINHELVVKKLQEIMAARGKKRTNRKEQIELLTELGEISAEHNLGIAISVKIQFAVISAIFDYNPKISASMKPEYWEKLLEAIDRLLKDLFEHVDDLTTSDMIMEDNESFEEAPYRVRGCFLSSVERMDEEFIKVLKGCDAHTHEYVERLRDEPRVVALLDQAKNLLEAQKEKTTSELCRIYLKKAEHIYFKFDIKVIQQKNGELDTKEETSLQALDTLCKYIYSKDTTDRLRTHAILFHIYHHAIHDNWYEARDLMLMSHLQDSIVHADAATQILYNRTMVQLGLCGFRHAEIREAHNCLLDIQLGGRSKELLAQGLLPQRHHERSSEQEKIEKQRQMPFHMHINLEMLECVYLVSAMLIEIPYMAAHEFDARRRMISKSYYQQLRSSERQALVGPPESMREHVVAASKAMRNGDWIRCRDYIVNEKMNAKVWDLFYEADKVRAMLTRKIQEESLRTYLFTYSKVYDSISLDHLHKVFELERTTAHAIVSKMIINEEIMASLDEPTQCMVMHRTEPTRLQSLSLQLSDKIGQLVENNERLLDIRQGNRWGDKGDGRDGRGGGRGGGRGRGDDNRNFGGRFGNRDDRDGGRGPRFGGGQGGQSGRGGYGDRRGGYGGDRGGRYGDRGGRGGGGRFDNRGGRFAERVRFNDRNY